MEFTEIWKFLLPRFATFFTAMTPIGELRASIPIALLTYGMNIAETYIISVIGNLVPVVAILWILEPVSKFLMNRFRLFNRFFNWLFDHTRRKHSQRFQRYTGFALIGFVAIPLPVTGGITGAIIAFVFGIPPRKAFLHIFYGILIAGIIVTVISKTIGYVKFITAV